MKLHELKQMIDKSALRNALSHLMNDLLSVLYLETPVGYLEIVSDSHGVTAADFVDQKPSDVPIIQSTDLLNIQFLGTEIQKRIWKEVCSIPKGEVRTYQQIAQQIGDKRITARTVGGAMSANRIAYLIPCHRVVKSNGQIGAYQWGADRKQKLLEWEKAQT